MPSASNIEQNVEVVIIDVKTVASGYRVSALLGSNVVNNHDERIGTIDDFIIGRDDRVLFTILQIGGFLGLGGRLVSVPYRSLVLDDAGGKIKVVLPGATRDELKKLPEFEYAD